MAGRILLTLVAAAFVALGVVWLGGLTGFSLTGVRGAHVIHTFPELEGRDAARPFAGDPRAPTCAPIETPSAWERRTTRSTSRRLAALSVPLPPEWVGNRDEAYHDGRDDGWGHIMASWMVPPPEGRRTPPWTDGSLSVWIDAEEGYPSYGRSDARQRAVAECRFAGPNGEAFLVTYELDTSVGTEYVASAYWPVAPGAWLGATGMASSPERLGEIVATLRGIGFTPTTAR